MLLFFGLSAPQLGTGCHVAGLGFRPSHIAKPELRRSSLALMFPARRFSAPKSSILPKSCLVSLSKAHIVAIDELLRICKFDEEEYEMVAARKTHVIKSCDAIIPIQPQCILTNVCGTKTVPLTIAVSRPLAYLIDPSRALNRQFSHLNVN